MLKIKELVSERKYRSEAGFILYVIRKEIVDDSDYGGSGHLVMSRAYTPKGEYIGTTKMARLICKKYGIVPELAKPEHSVCSIGFCPGDNKYYGWSHRAICGFAIGDKLFEEEFGDEHTPFVEHGNKTIETFDEAKQSAINFAESVS